LAELCPFIFDQECKAQNEPTKEFPLSKSITERNDLLRAASYLADSPYILQDLDQYLRETGFAGSTNIPQIVFLSAISRILPEPVSVVIKGESGIGKSFSLRAALNLIPTSAYIEVNGVSPRALVHAGKKHDFRHKVLVIQEAAGCGGDGWVYLRQLLTEKRIRYMTVAQTKDGHEGKDVEPVEGPIALMMTTTSNHLHPEDESRLLSLYVDQTRVQIKRAIMAHGKVTALSSSSGLDVSHFHALYEYVCSGSRKVDIPYVNCLLGLFPDSYPRVLRDIPKVISLISSHALLHQQSREKKGDVIQATFDDYEAIHRLLDEPLAIGLQGSVPGHILEVVSAVAELNSARRQPVSQVEVAEHIRRDQSGVSRNLASAVRAGFVDNQNPGQGRLHQYVLGTRAIPKSHVLPTPEQVAFAYSGASNWVNQIKPELEPA
jgi:hypothetical protein